MADTKNIEESLITELAFTLITDSEESEGFGFNLTYIDASGAESITHVDKKVILEFLQDEATKVSLHSEDRDGFESSYMLATNTISHESVKFFGLKDHYMALLDVVYKAQQTRKEYKKDNTIPLLSHDFIKYVNLAHQKYRQDEVGIANYRKWQGDEEFQMLYGQKPHEVHINSYINDKYVKVTSLNLALSKDVERLMTELIDWVNNTAFKDGRDIFHDIAEFHARFIKIHPFGDGNGRTARLLTNYLLLVLGKPMITIPIEEKEDYVHALNFANSDNLELSSKEINNFDSYLKAKLKKKQGKISDFETLDKMRTSYSKYDDLAEFLRNHQLPFTAKNCISQILNNYGMKNVGERIGIGKLSAEGVQSSIPDGEMSQK